MKLLALELNNFRNYSAAKLTFSEGVNVFLGPNAQGKTNLLEAIYFLALTKSHRTSNDKDLITWDQKETAVRGEVARQTGNLNLALEVSTKGKKARLNHLDQARLADYVGKLNVILFAPEDLDLVKGAPSVRRQFIDREFSQMSPKYLYIANQYRAVLKQRNRYLKQLQTKEATDIIFLEVLTDRLIAFGSELIMRRHHLLKQLEQAAQPIQTSITEGRETLQIKYVSQWSDADLETQESLSTAMESYFQRHQKKEIMYGVTQFGPQRDDLQFLVNERDVALFGSQGQQRTTALAVKLAEIDLMKQETGEYPILLLDDVLSELDEQRQTQLLAAMQDKVQTFLTTPSLNDVAQQFIHAPKVFNIHDGTISD